MQSAIITNYHADAIASFRNYKKTVELADGRITLKNMRNCEQATVDRSKVRGAIGDLIIAISC